MNNQAKDPLQSAYEMAINAWNTFKNVPSSIKNWWNTPAVIELGGPSTAVTPSPTPTPTPTPYILPKFDENTPIFNSNVSTESATPIYEKFFSSYKPSGASQEWRSPLMDYTGVLGSESGKYGLDPRFVASLALSEGRALYDDKLRRLNNPFASGGGNFQYPTIEEGIKNYLAGIAGEQTPPGKTRVPGVNRYGTKLGNLPPNATIRDYVLAHNPEDNPEQQIGNILSLINQYQ